MKTILIASLFFSGAIPSLYSNNRFSAPPAAPTAIRSVVAQGRALRMLVHVGEGGAYQLNIYSMDGQIVFQQTLEEKAGEVEQVIAFGDHAHGVYEVDMAGAAGHSTRQVMW